MAHISVLMPVYNADKYVKEAIDSIIQQTFTDFELIIVDDCSTDASRQIIDTYHDSRIIRLYNSVNSGVSFSLNQALSVATGKYIARMDADDISHSSRFEKQYTFLENHPDIGVLGSSISYIDVSGKKLGVSRAICEPDQLVWVLVFGNPFIHPTVMVRRQLLSDVGGYLLQGPAQDRELWMRLVEKTRFANLEDILLSYRIRSDSVTGRRRMERKLRKSDGSKASSYEIDVVLRHRFLQERLNGSLPIEVVQWLTESQKSQVTLNTGLRDEQIKAVIALMYDIYHALLKSDLIKDEEKKIFNDLLERIMKASRYSPACVMPGNLIKQWNRPVQRRLLIAMRLIMDACQVWPREWR